MAPSYSGVWKLQTQYQYRTGWPIDTTLLLAAGKALFFGGNEGGTKYADIDKINLASTGNATDFGNLSNARNGTAAGGSNTIMVISGGEN